MQMHLMDHAFDAESGTGAPDCKQQADVRAVDGTVPVKILRAAGAGTPRGQDVSEVSAINGTIVVEVARATTTVATQICFKIDDPIDIREANVCQLGERREAT